MYIQRLLFLAPLLFSTAAFSSWTKQPDDNLKIELGIVIPNYSVEIQAPKEISKKVAKYQPHSASKTALGLSYRNLGATLSTTNPTKEENNLKFGKSSSTDFQFRFFGKRTYEFFYSSYKGYYLENSQDLDPSYLGNPVKIQRPDMKTSNFGFNFYWNLHEKDYSQAVAFDQAGIQKGSGWGVSWLVHASDSRITADSPFIPSAATSDFGFLSVVKDVERQTLATGFGIGGIATWKNLYVTAFLAIGLGYQKLHVDGGALGEQDVEIVGSYISPRLGLGYNGEKNVLGLQLLSDNVTSPYANGEFRGSTMELKAFYAYRFDGINIPLLNPVSAWFD